MPSKIVHQAAASDRAPPPLADAPEGLDAIDLLEADHRQLEELFDRYDHADFADKRALASTICVALKVHARIEEDLFYPAALETTGAADLLAEAQVEHEVARELIAQIEQGQPGDPMFDARVRVLGEYVGHHMIEEEDEIFPLCREGGLDLAALGRDLAARRRALLHGLAAPDPALSLS